MDPPRQVSRRGPGSGPVFRNFKKGSSSSSKIPVQTSPALSVRADSSTVFAHQIVDPVPVAKRIRIRMRSGTTRRKHISTIDHNIKIEVLTGEENSLLQRRSSKLLGDTSSSSSSNKKDSASVGMRDEKDASDSHRRNGSRQRSRIRRQSSIESEKVTIISSIFSSLSRSISTSYSILSQELMHFY